MLMHQDILYPPDIHRLQLLTFSLNGSIRIIGGKCQVALLWFKYKCSETVILLGTTFLFAYCLESVIRTYLLTYLLHGTESFLRS